MALRDEIEAQPDVLRRLLRRQRTQAEAIAGVVERRRPRFIYLAGRGTSDNACRYAQYIAGHFHRLPAALAAPSLFSLYRTPPALADGLVIGISQSGRSPDMVAVIEEASRQGATTLAITNSPTSPLAAAAELVLDTGAGDELAVAATKTYTAQLFAIAMVSAALGAAEERWRQLGEVAGVIERALESEETVAHLAARRGSMEHCVVIGRGFNYATAHEWSLKLKELAHVAAEPYSPSDLQHGPITVLQRGSVVVAALARGAALDDGLRLLRRLRDEQGAELTLVSDAPEALALVDDALRLDGEVPEWLSPITLIVPAQLFCLHLALAKRLDPESPPGLTKVTCTW